MKVDFDQIIQKNQKHIIVTGKSREYKEFTSLESKKIYREISEIDEFPEIVSETSVKQLSERDQGITYEQMTAMAKDNIDPEELRNQLIIMKEQLQKSIKNKGPASMSAVSSVEPDMDYGQINIQIKQVHQPKRVRKATNEDIDGIGETMEEPDSPKMVKKRIVKKKSPAKQTRDHQKRS